MRWTIGIDPSSSKNTSGDFGNLIGWCVFKENDLQSTGDLIPDPLTGFTRVRHWLRDKIRMIRINDPDPEITVACETAFLGPNAAIFQGLIRVKAHLESVALDEACSYKEVSPQDSFRAATGLSQYPLNENGKRSGTRKPAIQSAVKERYHLPEETSEHIFDAIGIAEAIIQRKR